MKQIQYSLSFKVNNGREIRIFSGTRRQLDRYVKCEGLEYKGNGVYRLPESDPWHGVDFKLEARA